jgi:ElaA protein
MNSLSDPSLRWQCLRFRELDLDTLYDVIALRAAVFVVEQRCAYADLDGKDRDPDAHHLIGRSGDGTIAAYARLLPPGLSFVEPSIGRVVTAAAFRGLRLGDRLMEEALRRMATLWPEQAIRIGAQSYLLAFYRKHGFSVCSDEYLEDGIPHRDMRRSATHDTAPDPQPASLP